MKTLVKFLGEKGVLKEFTNAVERNKYSPLLLKGMAGLENMIDYVLDSKFEEELKEKGVTNLQRDWIKLLESEVIKEGLAGKRKFVRKFVSFMKEKGVWENYLRGVQALYAKRRMELTPHQNFVRVVAQNPIDRWATNCFGWDSCNSRLQKRIHWDKIHNEWEIFVRENQ